jgi:undecaprenyl-diphosphatase
MIVEILKTIIFGIVEGITEWLPISSTGHLILVEQFVKFKMVSSEFWSMFQVVIQFGAILAVVILYWKQIWPLTKNKEKAIKKTGILSYFNKDIMNLWGKIIVGCIPAAIVGLLFDDVFEALFYNPFCIAIALIVFGIAFIIVENWNKKRKNTKEKNEQITYKDALIIGIFQLLAAIFPGTSRSRSNYNWWIINRAIKTKCSRIYILFSNPNNARCKLIKISKIWICIYICRISNFINRYDSFICRINSCYKIFDELYKKTQFQSVWIL